MLTVAGPVDDRRSPASSNASGGSLVNQTHVPANLQFESSYAGANGVALSGGAGAYMSVYAPQTSITLSGRVAALRRAAREDARRVGRRRPIHYDVQLLAVWASYFENSASRPGAPDRPAPQVHVNQESGTMWG